MKKSQVNKMLKLSKAAQMIYVYALETQSEGSVFLAPLGLAEKFKLKRSRVYLAMAELQKQGIIESTNNRGFYKMTDGNED